MSTNNDCQISAIATACQLPYDAVAKAAHYTPLPLQLDSPIEANPDALYLILIALGRWKRNITWSDIEQKKAAVNTTVILIHNPASPLLKQHYIVLAGYQGPDFLVYWGDSVIPKLIPAATLKDYYLKGFPNCAFQVIQDTAWLRLKRWLGLEK
jgi:hypothetical protein